MIRRLIFRIMGIILLLLPLILSSGCLKAEINLDLTKDGSGFLDAKYSISENAINQLDALLKLSRQLDTVSGKAPEPAVKDPDMMLFLNPDKDKIRQRISGYAKHGITIERLDVESRNSWRSVNMRLKFANIAEVARADFFSDNGFSLYRRESGEYVFHRAAMNASGRSSQEPLMSNEAQRMLTPILEGFQVTVKVHTPGRVLESNAHSKTPDSTTWTFEQDRDPAAFQKLQNQTFAILIEGTGITIPDIRIVKKPQAGSGK